MTTLVSTVRRGQVGQVGVDVDLVVRGGHGGHGGAAPHRVAEDVIRHGFRNILDGHLQHVIVVAVEPKSVDAGVHVVVRDLLEDGSVFVRDPAKE